MSCCWLDYLDRILPQVRKVHCSVGLSQNADQSGQSTHLVRSSTHRAQLVDNNSCLLSLSLLQTVVFVILVYRLSLAYSTTLENKRDIFKGVLDNHLNFYVLAFWGVGHLVYGTFTFFRKGYRISHITSGHELAMQRTTMANLRTALAVMRTCNPLGPAPLSSRFACPPVSCSRFFIALFITTASNTLFENPVVFGLTFPPLCIVMLVIPSAFVPSRSFYNLAFFKGAVCLGLVLLGGCEKGDSSPTLDTRPSPSSHNIGQPSNSVFLLPVRHHRLLRLVLFLRGLFNS